jgi:hypothetical protein
VRSSAYGSRFRVQGLESGNVDPMRATPQRDLCLTYVPTVIEPESKYRICFPFF